MAINELQEIEDIWHREFVRPWPEILGVLNADPRLPAEVEFHLPHPRIAPPWFNGNINKLKPGDWILVVSLNPHINPEDDSLSKLEFSSDAWLEYWRSFNETKEHWNARFFPNLVKLSASILNRPAPNDVINDIATNQMFFVEFCPYASPNFNSVDWELWKKLTVGEPGFKVVRDIRQLLFDYGQPKFVLCNGLFSAYDVSDFQFYAAPFDRSFLTLPEGPDKEVWIKSWIYQPKSGPRFPVYGFNQYGRQFSNITLEKEIITRFIRDEPLLCRSEYEKKKRMAKRLIGSRDITPR